MKYFCCLVLAMILAMASFAGCSARNTAPSESEPSASSSAREESPPAVSAEEPESSAIAEDEPESSENPATASFALGLTGSDALTMRVGDAIGDWTLANLQIAYFSEDSPKAGDVKMLTATFAGDVTLQGTLTRSNLVEDAFDFWVADEDEGKMPRYVSPEMADKDFFVFMIDIPENLALAQEPAFGEELPCRITLSAYDFVFGYTASPAGATVTEIQIVQSS